jgi:archaetidylinositol phosphate synthase
MSHNTLLHRLVRPVVRRIAPTPIRPNHLTLLRIATALGAAAGFATGRAEWIWVGAGLFTLSALLDRADGELARATRCFSKLGHRLDLMADFGADALAFLAMGMGARDGWLGHWAIILGTTAAASAALLFWLLNRPGLAQPGRPISRRVDPDDLVLAIPLLACGFGLAPVLLLAGSVTPIAAIWLAMASLRVQTRVGQAAE